MFLDKYSLNKFSFPLITNLLVEKLACQYLNKDIPLANIKRVKDTGSLKNLLTYNRLPGLSPSKTCQRSLLYINMAQLSR